MQKNKRRIIPLIVIVFLVGARIYFSFQERERIERQQELIDDLSRQQREERIKNDEPLQIDNKELFNDLDEQKARLDSIGKELNESHKKFKEQFKDQLEKKY